MAKGLTSLAVGEALCEGKFKSIDGIARIYMPALKGTAYGASTLKLELTATPVVSKAEKSASTTDWTRKP